MSDLCFNAMVNPILILRGGIDGNGLLAARRAEPLAAKTHLPDTFARPAAADKARSGVGMNESRRVAAVRWILSRNRKFLSKNANRTCRVCLSIRE